VVVSSLNVAKVDLKAHSGNGKGTAQSSKQTAEEVPPGHFAFPIGALD